MTIGEQINAKKGFNHFIFIIFLAIMLVITWLSLNNVPAGNTYLILILTAIILTLVGVFITTDYPIRIPIEKSNIRFLVGFFIGGSIPLILSFFKTPFTFLQNTFSTLLFFNIKSAGEQIPFSALVAINDPFFSWFSVVLGGMAEEIIFIGFFIAGLLLAMGIRAAAKYEFGEFGNRFIDATIGLAFVGLFFSFLHQLNPLYDSAGDFILALVFRIIFTAITFYWLGLAFSMSFHGIWNAVFLGPDAFIAMLQTFGGVMLILLFILMIIALIAGFREIDDAFESLVDFSFQGDE